MKSMTRDEVYGYVGQRFTGITADVDAETALLIAEEVTRRASVLLEKARVRAHLAAQEAAMEALYEEEVADYGRV